MESNKSSYLLFFLAKKGIELMHNFKNLTNKGRFEVLLFNTEIILDIYRINNPITCEEVQKEYFEYLEEYIIENKINTELEDLSEFINNRFVFYAHELNEVFASSYMPEGFIQTHNPGKIYNAFYEQPLCSTPEFNWDLLNMALFSIPLKAMAHYVNDGVNIICKNE